MTAAALVAAAAEQLTPKGGVRTVTAFLCGIMLLAVLLQPIRKADTEAFSESVREYRAAASELTASAEEREKELLRTYIEEKYAAYILDEAHVLGAETARVRVSVKWGDGSWVPYEAFMDIEVTPDERSRLADTIFTQLGIPEERQHWNVDGQ